MNDTGKSSLNFRIRQHALHACLAMIAIVLLAGCVYDDYYGGYGRGYYGGYGGGYYDDYGGLYDGYGYYGGHRAYYGGHRGYYGGHRGYYGGGLHRGYSFGTHHSIGRGGFGHGGGYGHGGSRGH